MQFTFAVVLLGLCTTSFAANKFAPGIVPQDCLQCMCNVESQCKASPCFSGDGSTACGYFQITNAYWLACGSPGVNWNLCSKDLYCSSLCIQGYMTKYIANCSGGNTCENFSRLHHGGPRGCHSASTVIYWNRILSCMLNK